MKNVKSYVFYILINYFEYLCWELDSLNNVTF